MPFFLIEGDITKLKVDAIVNAANSSLLGGGGVDGAIHAAAGPRLLEECMTLHGCKTGDAKVTKGYNLPAKHVIHTVGPVWYGGEEGEEDALRSCYRRALEEADKLGCSTLAFPVISSGVYGYPMADAIRVAESEIANFLSSSDMTVYLVIYNRYSFPLGSEYDSTEPLQETFTVDSCCRCEPLAMPRSLDDILKEKDEGFSDHLFRLIREKGISETECYKKANIDRRLFSKIRSDSSYSPKKTTALAFAFSLHLSTSEAEKLLESAGFSLSRSSELDLIVRYFLDRNEYDIMEVNNTLFRHGEKLIGG